MAITTFNIENVITTRGRKGSPLTHEEMDTNFKLMAFGINILMLPYMPPFERELLGKVFNLDEVYETQGDYTIVMPEGVHLYVVRFNEGAVGSNVTISGESAFLGDLFNQKGSFLPTETSPSTTISIDEPMYIVVGQGVSTIGQSPAKEVASG